MLDIGKKKRRGEACWETSTDAEVELLEGATELSEAVSQSAR